MPPDSSAPDRGRDEARHNQSMIIGTHSIQYSTNADADRAFLRDVLGLPNVDVGGGWLIFGLPPSEVAVHPSEKDNRHELYLMSDDIAAFVAEMKTRNFACSPVHRHAAAHRDTTGHEAHDEEAREAVPKGAEEASGKTVASGERNAKWQPYSKPPGDIRATTWPCQCRTSTPPSRSTKR
jgi:hypothetical protein